ncbi:MULTISPECIES: DUF2878 family protein [Legionella]|uniref:DUF2878 domain-containing protein n=1 Tax=Legionella resiliens TaxID=2905958 RepID=A0ABS8X9N6_9GAMM|nr:MULTISPECIES: DUF2878 family protein [unclassified Legionella]MCE0724846.1 DUF2878 domain-containing protein [Legionella sp. 9fVS26]MCE3534000.1 DUF2878 domain-containing protein [Legionella sp. 8cVS16]QLZ70235.1 hypothetical protein FOLKNPGA_03040 [Legionella sp. PC1000]
MSKSQIGWCIHFLSYYLCWIACFYFAAQNEVYLGPMIGFLFIAVQIAWQSINRLPYLNALYFALLIGFIGVITDMIWLHQNYIYFKANPFSSYFTAPWMICIWLSFGLNLIFLNEKLIHYYFIWFLLILFLMPFAYKIGEICNIVVIENAYPFYFFVGITWALLLPASFYAYNYLKNSIS